MQSQQTKLSSSQLLGNSNYNIIINPSNSNQQGMLQQQQQQQQQMRNGGRYLNLSKGKVDQQPISVSTAAAIGNVSSNIRTMPSTSPSQMERDYLSINMNPSQSSEMGQYPMQSNTQMTQITIPSLSSQSSYMISASQEQDRMRNPNYHPSMSSKVPSMMRNLPIQKNDESQIKMSQNMNMNDTPSKPAEQRVVGQMSSLPVILEKDNKITNKRLDVVSLNLA